MAKKSARPPARKKLRVRSRVAKPTRAGTARIEFSAVAAQDPLCDKVEKWVLDWFSDHRGIRLKPNKKLKDPDIVRITTEAALIVLAEKFEGDFGSKVDETELKAQWAIPNNTLGALARNFLCKLAHDKKAPAALV